MTPILHHSKKSKLSKTLKLVLSSYVVLTLALNTSCSSNAPNDALVAPEGMNVLDLSKFGKPFALIVPDTTKGKFEIIEQASGALDIKIGTNFAISIFEQAADIELKKSDLKTDEINKLKTFIIDEPATIFWESEITQPEFHFLMSAKINGTDYSFQDLSETEAKPFGRQSVQNMLDACKNAKEIKKENPS